MQAPKVGDKIISDGKLVTVVSVTPTWTPYKENSGQTVTHTGYTLGLVEDKHAYDASFWKGCFVAQSTCLRVAHEDKAVIQRDRNRLTTLEWMQGSDVY